MLGKILRCIGISYLTLVTLVQLDQVDMAITDKREEIKNRRETLDGIVKAQDTRSTVLTQYTCACRKHPSTCRCPAWYAAFLFAMRRY
jgi:hypothetical protein